MDARIMRTTFSTAFLLASALAFGSGCVAKDGTAPPETPAQQEPGGGGAATGDEAATAPAAPGAPAAEAPAACVEPPAGTVVNVTVSDLKALLDTKAQIAVVDVREPEETEEGTIDGALLYPWTGKVLSARHGELPTDRPLYVVCRSGSRSAAATAFLAKNGHACVHNVQGGMNAWTAAAYPTAKD